MGILSSFYLSLSCLLAQRRFRSSACNILFSIFPYFSIAFKKHQVCLVHVEILGMLYHEEKVALVLSSRDFCLIGP